MQQAVDLVLQSYEEKGKGHKEIDKNMYYVVISASMGNTFRGGGRGEVQKYGSLVVQAYGREFGRSEV